MVNKIVAFDFDNTLTKFNVSSNVMVLQNSGVNDVNMIISILEMKYGLNNIFSDLMNNMYFANYLRLEKKIGTIFVIVTYGYKEVIKALLKRRGIYDIFSAIYTPIDFGLSEGYDHFKSLNGKNRMLEKAKHDFNNTVKNDKILLIDDNKKNVDSANYCGYKTIYVISNDGINFDNIDSIEEFIKK